MSLNRAENHVPHLIILSADQVETIYQASLAILGRTGISIFSEEVKQYLRKAGCRIEAERVFIDKKLIEWALSQCPSEIGLYKHNGDIGLYLKENNTYFGTGSDCPHILDPQTHEHRDFTRQDVADGIRVCDALPGIDFVMSMGHILDVPVQIADIWQAYLMLTNTIKPMLFTAYSADSCQTILEMVACVARNFNLLQTKPIACCLVNPDSPLKYSAESLAKLLILVRSRIPVVINSGPMMGGSGPVTMAGAIALGNAEVLAGIAIAQLVEPGAPIIYGLGIHPLDMRTAILAYGAPELAMTCSAATALARRYNLPCFGYAGCSDAKVVDHEAAMESTMLTLMALLSGANLVHDVGYLESGLTSSTEMLVLCDTIIEMCRRIMKGIEVSPETLALDVIARLGPGGNYLAENHTVRHMREIWYSPLIERIYYPNWVKSGELTLGEKIRTKTLKILAEHTTPPLPEQVHSELRKIIANYTEVKLADQAATDLR